MMLHTRSILPSYSFLRLGFKNIGFISNVEGVNRRLISSTRCLTSEEKLVTAATSTAVTPENKENKIDVTFVKLNGDRINVKGNKGDSLLDLVVNNSLDFDGFGACEGTLTCSTCHVILQQKDYDFLEKPSDEELDMLDLAYELTDTLVLFVLYNCS